MIRLRDARLTDAVPAVLARQPWAIALAYAEWNLRQLILQYEQRTQIYTSMENLPEEVLDALAVCLDVTWYDTAYPLETKRRVMKNATEVRRYLGTTRATKEALRTIWPNSEIEEWFDYGGEPGCFRVVCNISDPSVTAELEAVQNNVLLYKRESAHLDSISFMVKNGITIGKKVDMWKATAPECGMLRCGTWWKRSTLGASEKKGIHIAGGADAFTAAPPECGTLPEAATVGLKQSSGIWVDPEAGAWNAQGAEAGTKQAGTLPQAARTGESVRQKQTAAAQCRAFTARPAACGMARCGADAEKQ